MADQTRNDSNPQDVNRGKQSDLSREGIGTTREPSVADDRGLGNRQDDDLTREGGDLDSEDRLDSDLDRESDVEGGTLDADTRGRSGR